MWVKLDDGVMFHRKTLAASKDYCCAFTLWTAGLCYANRYTTDGQIPKEVVTALLPPAAMAPRKLRRIAALLCSTGRWIDFDDHYLIVGYEDEQKEALSVSIADRKRSQNDRKTRQRESNKNNGIANGVTRDSRARVPGPIRSDPIRSDPDLRTPLENPPRGVAQPPEEPTQALLLEPTPAKPRRKKRRTELAGETPEQITWRVWRAEYSERYGRDYVDAGSDGKTIRSVAAAAKAHAAPRCEQGDLASLRAEVELVVRHWVGKYLKDSGDDDYLASHCHPLRSIERDLPRYGLPWDRPRKAVASRRPELRVL